MNKTHRLVWSAVRHAFVVAPENAKRGGKPASSAKRLVASLGTALIAQAACAAPAANTLPTGGQVVAGQAAISQAGNAMTVQQGSGQAILQWNSFSIGRDASVRFQQPSASATALNRVVGSDPSSIYGSLSANGQVFLVNPNGVLFGAGGRVDVGGLVASTLNIRNDDFLAGNLRFTRDGSTAGVRNQGELLGQYVALLAPEVRNEGVITTTMGTAALAAGEAVTLGLVGHALIDVQVEQASINTLVENKQLVKADAGTVVLSAQSAHTLLGQVVNSGAIEAKGLVIDGGTVRLLASSAITHSGSITADAAANGQGGTVILMGDLANPTSQTTVSGAITAKGGSISGDGGFIETSANHLKISDGARIDTSAAHGRTGRWLLDPVDFTIAATGGDITGAALTAALASNSVTIQTAVGTNTATQLHGSTGANGDIFVNDTVSWSANALTLSADRHIIINAPLQVTGTGGLHLKFDQADGFIGSYVVNAPVNLAATSTFSTQAGTFSPAENYTVLVDQAGLMAMTTNDSSARYVLGRNVTASGNWTPVGNNASPFMGVFDGLGHVVSNLTVTGTSDYQGMFGFIGVPALVQHIGLSNANVSGTRFVGALVGDNEGSIYRSHASGTVTAATNDAAPITAVGGLVGLNNGVIDSSRSTVNVTATSDTGGNYYTGGGQDGGIGGLVGVSNSSISNSFATGNVAGLRDVGGLVGWANFNVEASYATGAVSLAGNGNDRINVGGLVGHGGSMLGAATSFWNTQTTGQPLSFNGVGYSSAGGMNTANMQTAANFTSATAANGNVNPNWDSTRWTLADGSYPGLTFSNAGLATAITLTVASASKVYGDANPALPGLTLSGCTDCLSLTGWGSALTSTTNAGDYAYSTPNLLVFAYAAGTSASDYTITWADPATYKFTVTPRTVTLTAHKTYDGTTALTGAQVAIGNLVGTQTLSHSGATASNAHVAAANKHIDAMVLGDGAHGGLAANYRLPTLDAAHAPVTINAATLTVTPTNTGVTKAYDGSTSAPSGFAPSYAISGLVAGDTAAAVSHTSATYNSKNVATASTITVGGLAISSITGSHQSEVTDYVLDANSKTVAAVITPKDITVSLTAPLSKVYDGQTAVAVRGDHVSIVGYAPGEFQLPVGSWNFNDNTLAGTFSDKNAAAGLTVTVPLTGWTTLQGTVDPANYNLPTSFTATGDITRRPVTVDWTLGTGRLSKVYDGNTQVSLIDLANLKVYATPTGLVQGEALLPVNASNQPGLWASFDSADAGTTRTVTLNLSGANWQGVRLDSANNFVVDTSAGNPNNYSFQTGQLSTQAEITPRPLTLAARKVYDGGTQLSAAQITLGNLVANETLVLGGSARASDAHVATLNKHVSDTSGLTLANGTGQASNYQFPAALDSSNAPVTIDKASLSLVGSRHYDGTTAINTSAATETRLIARGVNNESFVVTGTSSISGMDASTTAYALSDSAALTVGASNGTNPGRASDYDALGVDGSSFLVTRRPITAELVDRVVSIGKVYDGSTLASVSAWNFNYDVANFVAGEGAYLAGSNAWQTGSYDTKHVGTGKRVTVNVSPADYVPTGATKLSNYIFVDKATGVENRVTGDIGSISQKQLTASTLMTAQDKVYDGTRTATITLADQNALLGLESVDFGKVAITATGLFDSAAAGRHAVSANLVLAGEEAGNYSIAGVDQLTATIARRPVNVTASNASKLPNTDDPALPFTAEAQSALRGLVAGDTLNGRLSRDIGERIGTFAITQGDLTNANNPNYDIAFTPASFSIRQVLQPGTQFAGIGTVHSLNGLVDYAVSGGGSTTTLTPTDANILINWYSLNLPAGQTLVFDQPSASSVAVNRVTGATPSNLFGSLQSNGTVFLVNPNGILFGPGASVDVGGLVASAMNVKGLPLVTSPSFAADMRSLLSQPRLQFEGAAGDVNLQANLTVRADGFAGFYGDTVNVDGALAIIGGATAAAKTASWHNPNTLMLSAQGNINLNAPMAVQGTARLVLETGQGSAGGGNSDYSVFAAPTLAKTSSFATRQGNAGRLEEYTVVSDFNGLRSLSGDAGNVAIGANFSAAAPDLYNLNSIYIGFNTSLLAGLGHEVSGWGTGNRGFSGLVYPMVSALSGTMRDIGISINGTIDSSAGLVSWATDGAKILNSYVKGGTIRSDVSIAGGLVGRTFGNVSIKNSFVTSNVVVPWDDDSAATAGGLVGRAEGALVITNSHTTGGVSGAYNSGGLVGDSVGDVKIIGSYSTGAISGIGDTGGLIGNVRSATIEESFSTGNVHAKGQSGFGMLGAVAGGLAGDAERLVIRNSFATGDVTGFIVGGLLGSAAKVTISDSFAAGGLSGFAFSRGGLVGIVGGGVDSGLGASSITTSYSLSDFQKPQVGLSGGFSGGLVGTATGPVSLSHSYYVTPMTAQGGSPPSDLVGEVRESVTLSKTNAVMLNGFFAALFPASFAGFDCKVAWVCEKAGDYFYPSLRGLPTPRTTVPSVVERQNQTVASVVSAALNSGATAAGGQRVASLANQAALGLAKALSSPANTTASAQAKDQAIAAVKTLIAASCPTCSFSDADLEAWASGNTEDQTATAQQAEAEEAQARAKNASKQAALEKALLESDAAKAAALRAAAEQAAKEAEAARLAAEAAAKAKRDAEAAAAKQRAIDQAAAEALAAAAAAKKAAADQAAAQVRENAARQQREANALVAAEQERQRVQAAIAQRAAEATKWAGAATEAQNTANQAAADKAQWEQIAKDKAREITSTANTAAADLAAQTAAKKAMDEANKAADMALAKANKAVEVANAIGEALGKAKGEKMKAIFGFVGGGGKSLEQIGIETIGALAQGKSIGESLWSATGLSQFDDIEELKNMQASEAELQAAYDKAVKQANDLSATFRTADNAANASVDAYNAAAIKYAKSATAEAQAKLDKATADANVGILTTYAKATADHAVEVKEYAQHLAAESAKDKR